MRTPSVHDRSVTIWVPTKTCERSKNRWLAIAPSNLPQPSFEAVLNRDDTRVNCALGVDYVTNYPSTQAIIFTVPARVRVKPAPGAEIGPWSHSKLLRGEATGLRFLGDDGIEPRFGVSVFQARIGHNGEKRKPPLHRCHVGRQNDACHLVLTAVPMGCRSVSHSGRPATVVAFRSCQ